MYHIGISLPALLTELRETPYALPSSGWPATRSPTGRRVADGAGFEPARRFITVYTLSRRAPSTARPPIRSGAPRELMQGRRQGAETSGGVEWKQPAGTYATLPRAATSARPHRMAPGP